MAKERSYNGHTPEDRNSKILLLAPSGRDAEAAARALREAGIEVEDHEAVDGVIERIDSPHLIETDSLIVTEETLARGGLERLSDVLRGQPPWSDLPIILLATPSSGLTEGRLGRAISSLGNVTLLERPMRRLTLLTAVQVACRQRHRQLAMRSLLADQKRAVELRDHFLAMLGHELRNPLSAIVLATETLSCDDPGGLERYRELVSRQAGNLQRIVDDILDVSRATREKLRIERRRIDLRMVAKRAAEAYRRQAESEELRLETFVSDHPIHVDGDSVRLEQVMHNLISNAMRFTPPGGRIEVRAEVRGDDAVLEVADTGEGIPKDRLRQIFDLFTQVDEEVRRHRGGLGLGLALVEQIVRLHQGLVSAKSDGPDKGACFTVQLPRAKKREMEEAESAESEEEKPMDERREAPPHAPRARKGARREDGGRPAAKGSRKKPPEEPSVLVVEDDEDNREMLVMLLRRRKMKVRSASTGEEAIELARTVPFEVGLIDIGLPGIDGYEVGTRLRRLLGDRALLLALTGYGHPEAKRRTKEAGFDAHLTKPVDMKKLTSLMQRSKPEERPSP